MTTWSGAGPVSGPAGPVVVGVPDRGGDSLLPVAVGCARERDVPIELVRVWRTVDWLYSASAAEASALSQDEQHDRDLLAGAADHVRELAPDVPVRIDFAPGDLYTKLLDCTRRASALVIGDDLPEDASISAWFLEHAHCPVAVVNRDGHVIAESAGARDFARYGPHRS